MEVNEALSIQQRIKRANIAHRNANKLKIARDRSARKLAPESNIKSRAYAVARKILRKRIAGGRGAVYQELGPTEKISIDKQLDKKKALIKKIALRLIPKIRQSEQHRLQSFLKGKAMKNDINEAFEKKFKKTKKKPESYIKFFNKFTEEKQNNTGAYKSLLKKSEKHGVDVEAIGDIYNEAFNDFANVETNLTPEQYAFSRVNHELNELSKQTMWSYAMTAKSDTEFERGKSGTPKNSHTAKHLTPEQIKTHNKRGKGLNYVAHKLTGAPKHGLKSFSKDMNMYKEDLEESKNTPYVKPFEQNGKHVGWKASNKHGKLKFFGKEFKASANKHAGIDEAYGHDGMKQSVYSQQQLGKHVKTYKNVRGSKYDLYKNLNGHKLVNRISGASEDFPNHHVTRELHKKLLKTMLPEEIQLDEVSPSRTVADVRGAQHNLANLKRGIKPVIKKTPTWKQHMASYDKEEKAKYHEHKKHYEYHKAELYDLHKTYKDLHSGNLGIHKDDKVGQHGAEEEIESMKDKHREKVEYHLNKMHYHNSNLSKPLKIKEDLDEGRFIVSGRHQDQGFSKTKVYKADSEEHARKQFHDEFENFHANKIKKLTLNKMKNEENLDELSNPTLLSYIDKSRKTTPIYPKKNDVKSIQRNALTKKAINKVSDRYKNEEHDKCGTPECCGKCEPLDEFVLTAAAIASVAAARKTKKVAPKVGNYVKNQAFSQAGHLKDKIAGIMAKKEEKPETRMSSKEYLKKREALMKEDVDLTDRIENLAERNKENKFKKDLYVAKRGQKASKIWGLNKSDTADRAGHDHHIDYGDNDDHEDDASARHGMRKTAVRIYKKLGRRGLKEDSVNEVLGPENQIGTKALVKKLQKATPGQEKAQVNEQFEKELIHHGVVLHRTNKERKTEAGGYSTDHKVIKWSKQYDINPNLKSFSGKGAGHAHQFAHQKAVRDHPEVKKHLKDGWRVESFKIDPSKKPVLDHINNRLAYIKKQNGDLHLAEEIDLGEACWKGYKQLGMKKKGAKTVPNCVKEETDEQSFRKQHKLEKAKKTVRPNIWGSHVGYIGKKRYTTFPDKVAAKQWLGEDVKSAEVKGVIVPAYVDANGNTIPAKTIKRKQGNKILSTGNMQDGK